MGIMMAYIQNKTPNKSARKIKTAGAKAPAVKLPVDEQLGYALRTNSTAP
jgi:hypothetical protein